MPPQNYVPISVHERADAPPAGAPIIDGILWPSRSAHEINREKRFPIGIENDLRARGGDLI